MSENSNSSAFIEPFPNGITGAVEVVSPVTEAYEVAMARLEHARESLGSIEAAVQLEVGGVLAMHYRWLLIMRWQN